MLSGNKEFSKETELYEKIVSAINRLKPDFVVITGDLVNQKDDRSQVNEFKRITALIEKEIPVYFTPGNHDIGQSPTQEDIDIFKSDYGSDRFLLKHKKSLFIGLNSCLIKSGTPVLEQEQFEWLNKVLTEGSDASHTVLFTHYPFFIKWSFEPETYSNIAPSIRKRYLKLMKEKGVDAVFSGHLHKNADARFKDIQMITTSAAGKPLSNDPSGIRIIRVFKTNIESDYYSVDEIPQSIMFKNK